MTLSCGEGFPTPTQAHHLPPAVHGCATHCTRYLYISPCSSHTDLGSRAAHLLIQRIRSLRPRVIAAWLSFVRVRLADETRERS